MVMLLANLVDNTLKYTTITQKSCFVMHKCYVLVSKHGQNEGFCSFCEFLLQIMAQKTPQALDSQRFAAKSNNFSSSQVWASVLCCWYTLEGPRKKCRMKKLKVYHLALASCITSDSNRLQVRIPQGSECVLGQI